MTLKLLQEPNLDDMLENLDKRMPETLLMTNLLRMVKLHESKDYSQNFQISIEEDRSEKDTDFVLIVRKERKTDEKSYTSFSVRDYEDETTREKMTLYLTQNINWKDVQILSAISESAEDICASLMCDMGTQKFLSMCDVYILKTEADLPELEVPSGVTTGPLREEHAKMVDDSWNYKDDSSLKWITAMIQLGMGCGTYLNGELVSWICTYRYGGMGLLYTKPENRRRGFAKHCIAALSKKLLSMNLSASVYIEGYNDGSRKLFSQMGFQATEKKVFWAMSEPVEKKSKGCSAGVCCN